GVVIAHTLLDALDRAGFAVILPEVQNAFSLDLQGIGSVASVTIVAGIVLSVPAALWADRGARRTTFLAVGALIAAVFSITSAAAAVVWLFVLGRAGFGFGLI